MGLKLAESAVSSLTTGTFSRGLTLPPNALREPVWTKSVGLRRFILGQRFGGNSVQNYFSAIFWPKNLGNLYCSSPPLLEPTGELLGGALRSHEGGGKDCAAPKLEAAALRYEPREPAPPLRAEP